MNAEPALPIWNALDDRGLKDEILDDDDGITDGALVEDRVLRRWVGTSDASSKVCGTSALRENKRGVDNPPRRRERYRFRGPPGDHDTRHLRECCHGTPGPPNHFLRLYLPLLDPLTSSTFVRLLKNL